LARKGRTEVAAEPSIDERRTTKLECSCGR
jgi:hypothetical protein